MENEEGNRKRVFDRLGPNTRLRHGRFNQRQSQFLNNSSNNAGGNFPMRLNPNFDYTWAVPLVMGVSPKVNKNKVCSYWTQAKCTFGDRCQFLHPPRMQDGAGIVLPSSGEGSKLDVGSKDGGDVRIWDCLTAKESYPLKSEKSTCLIDLSNEDTCSQVKAVEKDSKKEGEEEEETEGDKENEGKGLASESTQSTRTRLSEQEMLERSRRKRQSMTMVPPIPTSPPTKKPRTEETKATPSPSNDVSIKLPSQFLEWGGDSGAIWPSAEQLAFPAPQQSLASKPPDTVLGDGIFLLLHSLQHFLAHRTHTTVREKMVKELTTKLEQEVGARLMAEEQLGIKTGELTEKQKQVDVLSEEVTRLKSKVSELREKLEDAASFYTWRSKARLMKQYMEGKTSMWTSNEDVDQFLSYIGKPEDLLPETTPTKDDNQAPEHKIDTEENDEQFLSNNSKPEDLLETTPIDTEENDEHFSSDIGKPEDLISETTTTMATDTTESTLDMDVVDASI